MKSKIAIAVLTFCVASPLWAQPTVNDTDVMVNVDSNNGHSFSHQDIDAHEFSVSPGIATGPSDENDAFSLDLDWLHRVHPIVQMGTELGYVFGAKLDGDVPSRILGSVAGSQDHLAANGDVQARMLHLTPEVKVGPKFQTPGGYVFQPFVIGGGGLYWTHYTSGNLNLTGGNFNNTPYAYGGGNDYNGGWNIGGGISYTLPGLYALGFEVRYHRILYNGSDQDIAYVIPSLRLSLLF